MRRFALLFSLRRSGHRRRRRAGARLQRTPTHSAARTRRARVVGRDLLRPPRACESRRQQHHRFETGSRIACCSRQASCRSTCSRRSKSTACSRAGSTSRTAATQRVFRDAHRTATHGRSQYSLGLLSRHVSPTRGYRRCSRRSARRWRRTFHWNVDTTGAPWIATSDEGPAEAHGGR